MLRYAITDRSLFHGEESERQDALVARAARWAEEGVDLVQLREKDLSAGSMAVLARRILGAIRGSSTRLLINHRADIALAVGADGVHLTGAEGELGVGQVRALGVGLVTVSCHAVDEVGRAASSGADAVVFAPVYEKPLQNQGVLKGTGLEMLREAVLAAGSVPVYALGGVTWENAAECVAAGARGVAGIRLFSR